MNIFARAAVAGGILLFSGVNAGATTSNVLLGKNVALVGEFSSSPDLATSLTDGVFLPKNNEWTTGTVWWDGNVNPDNLLHISLQGTYQISGLIVQADDNDAYNLYYLPPGGTWTLAYYVPNYDFEPFGMQTRPNPFNDTEQYTLPAPITATAFRINGALNDGDRLFSVSEIQAYGTLVPEPGSSTLLTCGLILVARRIRRRRG
jgi:hypothetical protein